MRQHRRAELLQPAMAHDDRLWWPEAIHRNEAALSIQADTDAKRGGARRG